MTARAFGPAGGAFVLVLATLALLPAPARAQHDVGGRGLPDQMVACFEIRSSASRLACFDSLARGVLERRGSTIHPGIVVPPSASAGRAIGGRPLAQFDGSRTRRRIIGPVSIGTRFVLAWSALDELEIEIRDASGRRTGVEVDSRRGGEGVTRALPAGAYTFEVDADANWSFTLRSSR